MIIKKRTGIDIISRRFSAFEKKALLSCLDIKKDEVVYDLGSGQSYFSLVLAFLGKKIIAIDNDFENFSFWKMYMVKKMFALKNLSMKKKDISTMNYQDFTDTIAVVYSGRFFHYLPYSDAQQLLKILHKKMQSEGKVYFSISGIDTDLAENYKGKNREIENRFFPIDIKLQKRFSVYDKVCLYSLHEARDLFAQFFTIESAEVTAFGNINIIAVKK